MKSLVPIIILSILFSACGNNDAGFNIQAPHNKYILCRGTALFLNDGEKWQANKETTTGIDSMLAQTHEFNLPADTSAYHQLGNDLMEDYLYIINFCVDMGPAHEMIHSYLFPIQEIIVPLQIGGLQTCESQFIKLQEYLARYHEYFE